MIKEKKGIKGILRCMPVGDTIKIPLSQMRDQVVHSTCQNLRKETSGKMKFKIHFNYALGRTEVTRIS